MLPTPAETGSLFGSPDDPTPSRASAPVTTPSGGVDTSPKQAALRFEDVRDRPGEPIVKLQALARLRHRVQEMENAYAAIVQQNMALKARIDELQRTGSRRDEVLGEIFACKPAEARTRLVQLIEHIDTLLGTEGTPAAGEASNHPGAAASADTETDEGINDVE